MAEKMDGKTMNITEENLNKLKDLFPEVFEEGKINFDKLQVVLGENIDKSNEKYEFSWNGKFEAMKLAQLQSTGTLIPCKEKSKDWDTTQNLYIEGDNLEVLKLLQKSYVNQIKMIYIDPPYNTGKDLVYKDSFKDSIENYKLITNQSAKSNAETDGRYHTNWLNMMYPRLKLARNLLCPEGIIFISIDDKEARNCKILCDEIFGENNFIAQIIVEGTPKNDPLIISTAHEYCLVYVKNYDKAKDLDWGVKNPIYDELEKIYEINKPNYSKIESLLKEYYTNHDLNSDNISNYKYADEYGVYRIGPIDDPQRGGSRDTRKNPYTGEDLRTPNSGWRCNLETWNQWIKDHLIKFPESNENLCSKKTYINSSKPDLIRAYFKVQTRKDTDMLESYFGSKVFQFPKPVNLIKTFIESANDKNGIYLDFFSGSGTMAHAVMLQNAEDNGKRKFILVQLPENIEENLKTAQGNREKQTLQNAISWCKDHKKPCYITEIAEERINIAGQKIKEKEPLALDNLDTGFKVFKLDTSNLIKWNNTPTEDVEELKKRLQQNLFYIVDGRSNMDLVYEIMLKYGLPLTLPITEKKYGDYKAYEIASDAYKVMICLDRNLPIEIIEQMTDEAVGTYVFADHCFGDANILINTEEILKKKSKNLRIF